MSEVVIVGGGPAGAVCGETLARAGVRTTLIDDHLAWEKPCGGGLTYKAIRVYPFLLEGPHPKKTVREIELIYGSQTVGSHNGGSQNGRSHPGGSRSGSSAGSDTRATFQLNEPLVIYSRRVLNGLLLERAERAGCRIVRTRATALEVDSSRPRVLAGSEEFSGDFLVVAAGARNRLFPCHAPLESADFEQTLGYYVPMQSDVMKIKFLAGFPGYLWSFPRPDHLSVGICGKLDSISTATLRVHLDQFMRDEGLSCKDSCLFSHLLPSPRPATVRSRRIVGKNWALVGDAAAMVDSITGEGLHYAMRSGELLGECFAQGCPEQYPARLRAEFGAELEHAAVLATQVFVANFAGAPMTQRAVQMARGSPTFRRLLAALVSGEQSYRTLGKRLWVQLPITLAEMGWSYIARSGR